MKPLHLYEISMIDGSRYRGEIAYRDEKMIVLKLTNAPNNGGFPEQTPKVRLFYHGIISIRELGWQKQFVS